MIQGGFVSKNDIRQAVERGNVYEPETYTLGIELPELELFITIAVRIDMILKIVDNVEKHIL